MQAQDIVDLLRKLAGGGMGSIVTRLRASTQERVRGVWEEVDRPPAHWLSIPAVQRRWAGFVSGDRSVGFPEHVARSHLAGLRGLRGLSMGCGTAEGELRWAELGLFDHIDAFDLSAAPVDEARRKAGERGLGEILDFSVANVADFPMPTDTYDVVLVEHALHHMAPMAEVVERVHRTLRPGGLFCLDEFVGPTRFQWTDRQLEAANALLQLLPPRYRTVPGRGVRTSVRRPSLLRMIHTDPSEAIESAEILPQVRQRFEIVEERGYGGSVLHLALADISEHFLDDDDAEAMEFIQLCCAAEDALLRAGDVGNDFAAVVARKRP